MKNILIRLLQLIWAILLLPLFIAISILSIFTWLIFDYTWNEFIGEYHDLTHKIFSL
jgi:hypothetical protein